MWHYFIVNIWAIDFFRFSLKENAIYTRFAYCHVNCSVRSISLIQNKIYDDLCLILQSNWLNLVSFFHDVAWSMSNVLGKYSLHSNNIEKMDDQPSLGLQVLVFSLVMLVFVFSDCIYILPLKVGFFRIVRLRLWKRNWTPDLFSPGT